MRTCIGIDYVCPSTRWEDVIKGPPAAISRAHVRRLLAFREPPADRRAVADGPAPALKRAA